MGDRLRLWVELVTKIMSVELGDQDDSFIWCVDKACFFHGEVYALGFDENWLLT